MNAERLKAAVDKVIQAWKAKRLSDGALENVQAWLTKPHYAEYRPRLEAMIDAEEFARLDRLFFEVIPFGTGGRRGLMADLGSATVNPRTIAESAQGLATYLKTQRDGPGGRAVVAHDTRNRSVEFARLTATTLAANGLTVFYFESHRATPELSFAVRRLGCDVGVMISASHNPPSDNGFKAYWSHGGQILPPHDEGIIECVYQTTTIPTIDFNQAVREKKIEIIGAELDREFIEAVASLSLSDQRAVPAIYTPLHGVGESSVYAVLKSAGFERVELFEPQRAADGNFTNVPGQLPNPERTEVFAPAIARAKEIGAEIMLASDPDADRLGVCVRGSDGEYVHLTGHRIGALLTDYVLRRRAAAGTLTPQHYIVETLVTTPLVAAIGRKHGVRVIDDLLVGFKYIAETMEGEGPELFVFGAEESLGYLAGQYARDKDAAIAALYLLELAAELRREGKTLLDRLDELFIEHGYFAEGQRSKTCEGSSGQQQIEELMRAFREAPPAELGGRPLDRVLDFGRHEVRSLPANAKSQELPRPDGDLLIFEWNRPECRMRCAVRPSGTEPKIKFYFFAESQVGGKSALPGVRRAIDAALGTFADGLSAWVEDRLRAMSITA
ncbi:MAG: phospho-sugar mutase [Planctomycetaceae bacterium]